METRASYFLVGLFVLALLTGIFGFVMWLGRSGLQDERIYYYIYTRGSVAGLQNGAPVQYRGVPVGTVTDIAIDEENVELIQITVAIRAGTPIKTDTIAQLQLQGITGLSYVQLSGGTREAASLEPPPGKRRARIRYQPSAIEKVFEDVPEAVGQVVALAARANELLSEENVKALSGIIANVNLTTETVAGTRSDIQRLVTQAAGTMDAARETAVALQELTTDLRTLTANLGGDARQVAKTADETAKAAGETARSFSRVAAEIQGITQEARAPLRDFSEGGLYELSQFLSDARALVTSLNRIALQFERDPARFLFGDQQKGLEAR
jgi:phospholipid/cholesterol/gamma-HCH transport system substrate-binding protein